MRRFLKVFVTAMALATFATSADVFAHGTPIQVTVVNNVLSVSGGLADSAGFAPMIFVETSETGDPFGEVNLPGFGQSIIWQIPGYEISGLDEHSGLFLDPMSRPFAFSDPSPPPQYRGLWYWSPQSQAVAKTPPLNPLQIRKSATANVTISPTSGIDPPPLQIAEPLSSDENFHNHLVAYALNEDTPPPTGAYGFFARLTSNQYGPSAPFLVVLNNEVFDYDQMVPAALAINAAAFLPGDYNHDDWVDAADYVVWKKTFGSTTALAADGSANQVVDQADYDVWRRNFGLTVAAGGLSVGNVPEPNGWALTTAAALLCCALIRIRASSAAQTRCGPLSR